MNTRLIERRPTLSAHATPAPAVADFLSIGDLGPTGVQGALDLAAAMKARPLDFANSLAGKQLVLIFEKPSLRTRLTFEVGMAALGGNSFFLDQREDGIGRREPICDVARNLDRWVHGIVLRTFAHATVTEMAAWTSIPVINALSDLEHPCQALADYLTLQEKFGDLRALKLAYVGDGNNVAHSLILAAACLGSAIAVATPAGYGPNPLVVNAAKKIAKQTGAKIELDNDPVAAVRNANAVYTDVWASMGQEQEAEARKATFASYQVNEELMSHAKPQAVFMHCLPAHRGDEVTDAVMESAQSVVFDQAENRLHVQKAILLMLLGGGKLRLPARRAHV
jgi:ornithine carbamoyltransferase